LEEFSKPE
jgi:ubiquitin carboxyl-terminal hydrolase 4/11